MRQSGRTFLLNLPKHNWIRMENIKWATVWIISHHYTRWATINKRRVQASKRSAALKIWRSEMQRLDHFPWMHRLLWRLYLWTRLIDLLYFLRLAMYNKPWMRNLVALMLSVSILVLRFGGLSGLGSSCPDRLKRVSRDESMEFG